MQKLLTSKCWIRDRWLRYKRNYRIINCQLTLKRKIKYRETRIFVHLLNWETYEVKIWIHWRMKKLKYHFLNIQVEYTQDWCYNFYHPCCFSSIQNKKVEGHHSVKKPSTNYHIALIQITDSRMEYLSKITKRKY